MNLVRERVGICALFACAAAAAQGGLIEEVTVRVTLQLRIVAQPLDEALQEFSRQSGVQVVFFSNVAEGIRSPGANGTYTVDEALRALLAGSGLAFRIINSRTVEIYRPAQPLSTECCNG